MIYEKINVYGVIQHSEEPKTFPLNFWYVNNITLEDIDNVDNYIFYAKVMPPLVFKKIVNHEDKNYYAYLIPFEVIRDARMGKAKIVIDCLSESYSGDYDYSIFTDIETFMQRHGMDPDTLMYVSGNLYAEDFYAKSVRYEVRSISALETWLEPYEGGIVDFVPDADSKDWLYLNLNRRPRDHRLWMLCELHRAGLMDQGKNSFNFQNFEPSKHAIMRYDSDLEPHFDDLVAEKERIVDLNTKDNLAINLNLDLYAKTFLTLTTETVVSHRSLQFSEKVWKPILVGHPFLLYGSTGSLEMLRDIGFLTFGEWFDESYDTITDLNKKTRAIVEVIEKLSKYDVESLKTIRSEMEPVLEYNQWQYREIVNSRFYVKEAKQVYGDKPALDIIVREWAKVLSRK